MAHSYTSDLVAFYQRNKGNKGREDDPRVRSRLDDKLLEQMEGSKTEIVYAERIVSPYGKVSYRKIGNEMIPIIPDLLKMGQVIRAIPADLYFNLHQNGKMLERYLDKMTRDANHWESDHYLPSSEERVSIEKAPVTNKRLAKGYGLSYSYKDTKYCESLERLSRKSAEGTSNRKNYSNNKIKISI